MKIKIQLYKDTDVLYIFIYIRRHVFRPSQGSSVWLGLTSRELMSPECSKHQVLSFAQMLVVQWTNKKYSVLISVFQSAQWINSERIYPQTCVSSFPGLISHHIYTMPLVFSYVKNLFYMADLQCLCFSKIIHLQKPHMCGIDSVMTFRLPPLQNYLLP